MKRPLAFAAALLIALPAAAQTDVEEPARVEYLKHTTVDITETKIEGTVVGPDGAIVRVRPKTHFKKQIAMRANFRPELQKSANGL